MGISLDRVIRYLDSDIDKALTELNRITVKSGADAEALFGFAVNYAKQMGGKLDKNNARICFACYRKLLKKYPDHKQTLLNIALLELDFGDIARALQLTTKLYKQYPREFPIAMSHVVCLEKNKRYHDALLVLPEVLKLQPDNIDVQMKFIDICELLGDRKNAVMWLRLVLKKKPDDIGLLNRLSVALHGIGEREEAELIAQQAIDLSPDLPAAYFAKLEILFDQDRFQDALDLCDQLTQKFGGLSWVTQKARQIKKILGNFEVEEEEQDGWSLAVYLDQVERKKVPLTEDQFAELEEKLSIIRNSNPLGGSIYRLMATNAGLNKDYKSEIEFLRKANQEKSKFHIHQSTGWYLFQEKIERLFGELSQGDSSLGDSGFSPIFVIGCPRSGSTLTEQIISSLDRVEALGESAFYPAALGEVCPGLFTGSYDDKTIQEIAERVGESYKAKIGLSNYPEGMRFVDKNLFNFRYVGLILRAFPNAKLVHTFRHPVDNAIGMFKQNFGSDHLNFTDDFESIVRFYADYQAIMQFWSERYPNQIFNSRYEDLIADFEGHTQKLFEFCELEWSEAVLSFHKNKRAVKTASLAQVRQPIYKSAVDKWRVYESYIADLLEMLRRQGIEY